MGYDEIPHEESHYCLHVGHINAPDHAWHRYKGDSRKRSPNHAESHYIPRRLAVASKKGIIVRLATGQPSYKHQESKIYEYGQKNVGAVHVFKNDIFFANVRKNP